ncbi:hypothetical protein GCK72_023271 [Caenorhabditis remanei]|uniref:Uncharacterized protein n=1 Tax=Caenorhabditis remanei TaxID=31234 RepID=A0A6A5FW73_CAERE|nr:hypothetical protein GCK72_023271 [Caenorhabditis remanei]KAF1746813.1 hypothetical protein GCK72_023271 [Caenorhabditis remanei]
MTDLNCNWEKLLKRAHSPDKETEQMFNYNEVKQSKTAIAEHVQQDHTEKDNQYGYGKSYLYILPRKISIYGPHFKYGPNRRHSEEDDDGDDGREEHGSDGRPCDSELNESNGKPRESEEESPSDVQFSEDNLKGNKTDDQKKALQTA